MVAGSQTRSAEGTSYTSSSASAAVIDASAHAPRRRDGRAGMRPDGAFDKGGGWDTSYQAVAVDIGMDVHAAMSASPARDALAMVLAHGATRLTDRVRPDGRVNSAGNRRTRSGGE